MLLVEFYRYFILIIVTIWTFRLSKQYQVGKFDPVKSNFKKQEVAIVLFAIILIFLIGLRPLENGMAWQWVDTGNYYRSYLQIEGDYFYFDSKATNLIWDNLFNFWASNRWNISYLFLIGDAIYFGCTYLACRKLFPHDTTAAYLVFLGAFSTYSYSFNGVKAGIAAALFLMALAYYEIRLISVVFVLLSWGFHHSMQMPVAAYILTLFFKSPKWYFYGWAFCVVMALLHVSAFQELFADYTDESGQGYLLKTEGEDFGGAGGFRFDFLLYSAVPVYFGYIFIMKEERQISNLYRTIMNMYLCTNGIWCLCMYASYCNRIAYLSWFMYPILLVYPFLKEDLSGSSVLKGKSQYSYFTKVMMCHVAFTIFMEVIFYNFIKS